jgi:hypothetical protein
VVVLIRNQRVHTDTEGEEGNVKPRGRDWDYASLTKVHLRPTEPGKGEGFPPEGFLNRK